MFAPHQTGDHVEVDFPQLCFQLLPGGRIRLLEKSQYMFLASGFQLLLQRVVHNQVPCETGEAGKRVVSPANGPLIAGQMNWPFDTDIVLLR